MNLSIKSASFSPSTFNKIFGEMEFLGKGKLINRKQWADCIKIINEFGQKINGKYNLITQDYLWEIIINIREHLKSDLEQAIRVNLQLCYSLEEEKQIKDINYPLFRFNHVLDQDFYRLDNDSYLGLRKFLKLIQATYGSPKEFIINLKEVKENLCFVRKRHDQNLIKLYRYLKNIYIPLRGYQNLRISFFVILEIFTQLKVIIVDVNAYHDLLENINKFKNQYIKRYKDEHLQFQQKLWEFNRQLYLLPEYKTLECLSQIKVIEVAYNLKLIKKYIESFFPKQCQLKNLDDILDKQAQCLCGFTLGEVLTIPSLAKIIPMLRKGIIEYLKELQNNRFRDSFMNYLSHNPDSALKNILNLGPKDINEILKDIDSDLVKEINEALSNTSPFKISFTEIII